MEASTDGSTDTGRDLGLDNKLEELVGQAVAAVAKITAIGKTAEAAGDIATASQKRTEDAESDARASVAEIVSAKERALERESEATKAWGEVEGKIKEVTAAGEAIGAARDSAKESQAAAATAAAEAQTKSGEIADIATEARGAQAKIKDLQSVIATKSEHIEGGRVHADEVRAKIDRLFTEAQQSATNAEAQHQATRTTAESLSNLYASAQTTKANVDSVAESVTRLREQCEEHAATAKGLADIATTTEEKVGSYEAQLAELVLQANERLKFINSLLSGATSASLGSAFEKRRLQFKWPQRMWQGTFIVSVLALLALAGLEFGFYTKPDATLSWGTLGLSLLHRLPFALPLIWLAFHAAHKAALAQRVEEDYGFKETVSRSFEGYRREMGELEGIASPTSALTRYCTGVMGVITSPPGRIYERHALNKTPFSEAKELFDSAGKAAKNAKPEIPGM